MKHSELCKLGAKWLTSEAPNLQPNIRCQMAVVELNTDCNEKPDIYGLRPERDVLIEVKTSVSDFKADNKKKCRNTDN